MQQANDINIHVKAPKKGHHLFRSDLKPDLILDYKRKMGIQSGIDNVLVVTFVSQKESDFVFNGKKFDFFGSPLVMSFEDFGIVIIGANRLGHFNGVNLLIPKSDILDINYDHHMMNKDLNLTLDDHLKNTFRIADFANGDDLQHHNYLRVDDLIRKYQD